MRVSFQFKTLNTIKVQNYKEIISLSISVLNYLPKVSMGGTSRFQSNVGAQGSSGYSIT